MVGAPVGVDNCFCREPPFKRSTFNDGFVPDHGAERESAIALTSIASDERVAGAEERDDTTEFRQPGFTPKQRGYQA